MCCFLLRCKARAKNERSHSTEKLKASQMTLNKKLVPTGDPQNRLECIGKHKLLKAQFCALNTSDSTTIHLTVQNCQITSYVPDSTDSDVGGFK